MYLICSLLQTLPVFDDDDGSFGNEENVFGFAVRQLPNKVEK